MPDLFSLPESTAANDIVLLPLLFSSISPTLNFSNLPAPYLHSTVLSGIDQRHPHCFRLLLTISHVTPLPSPTLSSYIAIIDSASTTGRRSSPETLTIVVSLADYTVIHHHRPGSVSDHPPLSATIVNLPLSVSHHPQLCYSKASKMLLEVGTWKM
ncbi:unnamed protein product [Lactuca virosa]|uniref:Uncharacterized protein n=1 Tax=Lactuca virosa TaxID=75947 RepID=A0AAU9MPD7_9ASTR|nr:unnamed protein product [Lactuca virosa]